MLAQFEVSATPKLSEILGDSKFFNPLNKYEILVLNFG